jgi:hypothetical protein
LPIIEREATTDCVCGKLENERRKKPRRTREKGYFPGLSLSPFPRRGGASLSDETREELIIGIKKKGTGMTPVALNGRRGKHKEDKALDTDTERTRGRDCGKSRHLKGRRTVVLAGGHCEPCLDGC